MVNLLRRRDMVQAHTPSEWDYVWSYLNGVALTDDGWTTTTGGTSSTSLTANGQQITSSGTGYTSIRNELFNVSDGVMEIDFYFNGFNTSTNNAAYNNGRFCLSNGTHGIQVSVPKARLMLMNNNPIADRTYLGVTLVANKHYTLRLILHGDYGDVWLDGTELIRDVDITTILYSGITSIWSQGAGGKSVFIQAVRLKLNRIS